MHKSLLTMFMRKRESHRNDASDSFLDSDPSNYILEGTYSYEEVVMLNGLTSLNMYFGHCAELGSIALIGIPDANLSNKSVFLQYNIHEYGFPFDEREFYVKPYLPEESKQIKTYTVYGITGLETIFKAFKKLQYTPVYKMQCKDENETIS